MDPNGESRNSPAPYHLKECSRPRRTHTDRFCEFSQSMMSTRLTLLVQSHCHMTELHPCSIKTRKDTAWRASRMLITWGELRPEGTEGSPRSCPVYPFICILCNMLYSSPRNTVPCGKLIKSKERTTGIPIANQPILKNGVFRIGWEGPERTLRGWARTGEITIDPRYIYFSTWTMIEYRPQEGLEVLTPQSNEHSCHPATILLLNTIFD